MNGKRTLTSVGIAIMVLALLAGLAAAQGPEPPKGEVSTEEANGVAAAVTARNPYPGTPDRCRRHPLGRHFQHSLPVVRGRSWHDNGV